MSSVLHRTTTVILAVGVACVFNGCTTIQAVSSGGDGHLYVAATRNYLLYTESYLLDCWKSDAETVTCARMLDGELLGELAPGGTRTLQAFRLEYLQRATMMAPDAATPTAEARPEPVTDTETALAVFDRFLLASAGGRQSDLRELVVVWDQSLGELRSLTDTELMWLLEPGDYGEGQWVTERVERDGTELRVFTAPSGKRTTSGARGKLVILREYEGEVRVLARQGKWYLEAP